MNSSEVFTLILLNPNNSGVFDISGCTVHWPSSIFIPTFTLILISKNVPLISSGRCWESIDDTRWWIIKAPILVTILVSQVASLAAESSHTALLDALMLLLLSRQVNFILFICIIRILRQKMNCPDMGRKESNQYS